MATDLPYFKFSLVSYSHVPVLTRHISRSLFCESGNVCYNYDGQERCKDIHILLLKDFFLSCHK